MAAEYFWNAPASALSGRTGTTEARSVPGGQIRTIVLLTNKIVEQRAKTGRSPSRVETLLRNASHPLLVPASLRLGHFCIRYQLLDKIGLGQVKVIRRKHFFRPIPGVGEAITPFSTALNRLT
jgi:hypothetical protein